ncbi:MAG: sugar ABC transporter permease, partial [Leifsonia sp.]|nr:sugar ABC transporter permease [Leifsonia sp.]
MTAIAARTGRAGAFKVPVRPGLRRMQRRRLLTALAMLAPALLGLGLFFGYP